MATTKRTTTPKSEPKHASGPDGGASAPTGTPTAQSTMEARSSERSTSPDPSAVELAEVEREAYFIWLERGGNEVVNWIEAERRVRTRNAAKGGAESATTGAMSSARGAG